MFVVTAKKRKKGSSCAGFGFLWPGDLSIKPD